MGCLQGHVSHNMYTNDMSHSIQASFRGTSPKEVAKWTAAHLVYSLYQSEALPHTSIGALQLASQRDRVCAISAEATQEAALEGMLRKVQEKWIGVELTVKQYKEAKDAYILGSVEDVQAVLEDSLAMMATISSSRFVAGLLCFATHSCCKKRQV